MACECNYVMLSVCIILFLGVASQTVSFALPGWVQFTPKENTLNGTEIVFKAGSEYSAGLWVECEGGIGNCKEWVDDSINFAKDVGECSLDKLKAVVPGQQQKTCRKYNNIELTMWVTQALGLFFMALALVFSILATVAFCCGGGCCGDCCVGFCKFIILLICMLATMSITTGLVLYGVTYSEEKYQGSIVRNGFTIVLKDMQLYYCFALSALAACLGMLAAIISAFSRNDDGKV